MHSKQHRVLKRKKHKKKYCCSTIILTRQMDIIFRDSFITSEYMKKWELSVLKVKSAVIQNADICPFTRKKDYNSVPFTDDAKTKRKKFLCWENSVGQLTLNFSISLKIPKSLTIYYSFNYCSSIALHLAHWITFDSY